MWVCLLLLLLPWCTAEGQATLKTLKDLVKKQSGA
jgi:hypothetical protein